MNCRCGKLFVCHTGTGTTLVGYYSPPGHNHDDNCRKRAYFCADGHVTRIRRVNVCQTEGCGWKGKATCFCHEGTNVDEWPDAPYSDTPPTRRGTGDEA